MTLTTSDNPRGPIQLVLDQVILQVGGDSGIVMVVNHDNLLRPDFSQGINDETIAKIQRQGIASGKSISGYVAETKKPLVLPVDGSWQKELGQLGITAGIFVPMEIVGITYGVLEVYSTQIGHHFTNDDLNLLLEVAAAISRVLIKERYSHAVKEASASVNVANSIEELGHSLLVLKQILRCKHIGIFCPEEGKLRLSSSSEQQISLSDFIGLDSADSPIAQAFKTERQQTDANGDKEVFLVAIPLLPSGDGSEDPLGVLVIENPKQSKFLSAAITVTESFAEILAGAIQRFEADRIIVEERIQSLETTVQTIGLRDDYTGEHSKRVTVYAVALAEQLGLSPELIQLVEIAATLHDIGKIRTPDAVLCKTGKFDDAEWKIMKDHPVDGATWLNKQGYFDPRVIELVRLHHQRPNGQGYPEVEDQSVLTPFNLLLSSADTLDAMITIRCYQRQFLLSETILELIRCSGPKAQFHAENVLALCQALKLGIKLPEGNEIAVMKLTEEDAGVIGAQLWHRQFRNEDVPLDKVIPVKTSKPFLGIFPHDLAVG